MNERLGNNQTMLPNGQMGVKRPYYSGTVIPVQPKPRTKEAYSANYPIPTSGGYFLSVKFIVKQSTLQYPEPKIMLGFNGGGRSCFATMDNIQAVKDFVQWLLNQIPDAESCFTAEMGKGKLIEEQLTKAQQQVEAYSQIAKMQKQLKDIQALENEPEYTDGEPET